MKYLFFSLVSFFLALPVYAQKCEGRLCNPLNDTFSSVPGFVAGLAKVVVIMAVPIVALMLVYSGFLFVSARGNQSKLHTAKDNFLYVIIGATLILGAWVFASLLWGTIGQLLQGGNTIPREQRFQGN